MISKYRDYILWVMLFVLCTCYLYFCGLKKDWQELRIKSGIENNDRNNPPKLFQKCIFENKTYSTLCVKLFFFTGFVSLLIFAAFYISSSIKRFNEIMSAASVFLSLIFIYSIFAGAPQDNDMIPDSSKDKIYARLLHSIAFIKHTLLNSIVNCEYEYLRSSIISKIKNWYTNDKVKFEALIIRIDSDFFNKMLPNDTDDSIKSMMRDTSYNILILYDDGDITVLDETINLFEKEMLENGTKLIELAKFIDNHEAVSTGLDKGKIDRRIKKHIEFHKQKNITTKSMSEIITTIEEGSMPDIMNTIDEKSISNEACKIKL